MGLICYSLRDVDDLYCRFLAETRPENAIEIRLDKCDFDVETVKELFSTERGSFLIATYRCELPSQVERAVELLTAAIFAGADYIDLGTDIPPQSADWLMKLAMNRSCKTILSFHDHGSTPTREELEQTARDLFRRGADIVKVVTTAVEEGDAERVTSLYDSFPADQLVAFAMGPKGENSRLESYAKGAPLFYISPTRGYETAPGQPTYFDFVRDDSVLLRGEAVIPASKSFAQRVILLASLTEGQTRLFDYTPCDDSQSALAVAMQLGADVWVEGTTVTIVGHQDILRNGLKINGNRLHVGESGLLARLCIPLAGLCAEDVTIVGEKSLCRRRISEHKGALRQLGLHMTYTDGDYLPVTVGGTLKPKWVKLNGIHGSQMISGLMIALSQCHSQGALQVNHLTSQPYLDLTSTLGSYFGLEEADFPEDPEDDTRTYLIEPNQQIRPTRGLSIEKDWSSAAFFMVAGAIMGDVTIRGMNLFSDQADAVIFDFLEQCHVDMVKRPDGSINVRKSIICPFNFDLTDAPDLFAPLLLLALRADGESCISGMGRLHNKESDRARTFAEEFRNAGAEIRVKGDDMFIQGEDSLILRGGKCSSHGDHRLAMALLLAGLISQNGIQVDDVACISKSFPTFMENLNRLAKKPVKETQE